MATVHPGHENFNMVFNIMIGIKKAVDSNTLAAKGWNG